MESRHLKDHAPVANQVAPFTVGIAGGSGSGKTTLAERLAETLKPDLCTTLISQDDFYRDLSHLPVSARTHINFDAPDNLDLALAADRLRLLKAGEKVEQADYDFCTHTPSKTVKTLKPASVLIFEGIHALYNEELRASFDLKLYVSAPTEVRRHRRTQRDLKERGRSLEDIERQLADQVMPMHRQHVAPAKAFADFILPGDCDLQDPAYQRRLHYLAQLVRANASSDEVAKQRLLHE